MDRQRQGVAYSRETYLLGNRLGVGTICDLFLLTLALVSGIVVYIWGLRKKSVSRSSLPI